MKPTLTPGLRVNYIPTQLWQSDADVDADGDSYSHGHGSYASGNANGYRYSHGCGNRYADSNCGTTASNSDTAAAANTGASPVGRSGGEKILTISL